MRSRFLLPALGLATLAGTFGAVGCVENRSSLFVIGMTRAEDAESCGYEATLFIETPISRGLYDLSAADNVGYSVAMVVGNQLQPLGDDDRLRTETSRIQLEELEIAVEAVSAGASAPDPSNYIVRTSSLVDTSQGQAPGLGIVFATLIPPGAITDEGEYEASIILRGRTLGGTEIESGEYFFTIDVIAGALASPPTADGERAVTCSPGSNEPTDCCGWPYEDGEEGYCGDAAGCR